jgi:hypothetical protein
MKIESGNLAYDPVMTTERVRMEAGVDVLDNTMEMAQMQAEQLIEMMSFQDPMMGQNIDIKV